MAESPHEPAPQPSIEDARRQAFEQLAGHADDGLMTFDEYAEHSAAIARATSAEELEQTLRRLPTQAAAGAPSGSPRWLVAILGGTDQGGLWRLGKRLAIVAVFGGVKLDLGRAQPEARESQIIVFTLFGGAELTAPAGVPIQLSGFTLMGGRKDERPAATPLRGAPLIRVRHLGALGGVAVKSRG